MNPRRPSRGAMQTCFVAAPMEQTAAARGSESESRHPARRYGRAESCVAHHCNVTVVVIDTRSSVRISKQIGAASGHFVQPGPALLNFFPRLLSANAQVSDGARYERRLRFRHHPTRRDRSPRASNARGAHPKHAGISPTTLRAFRQRAILQTLDQLQQGQIRLVDGEPPWRIRDPTSPTPVAIFERLQLTGRSTSRLFELRLLR